MNDKFPESQRNFETRLLFIKEVFSNLFPQYDIMAHCIVHKLDRSYLIYVEQLQKSTLFLTGQDPIKVLRRMD